MNDYSQQIESLIEQVTKLDKRSLDTTLRFELKHPLHATYFINYIKSLLKDLYEDHRVVNCKGNYFLLFLLNNRGTKILKDMMDFKRRLEREEQL